MTEPTETIDPVAQAAADLLSFTKQSANKELILHLNGLTTNHLAAYPQAEVQSWDLQKSEAEAVMSAGESATLDLAPFLAAVCAYHLGEATDAERLTQLKQKAAIVQQNATAWALIAQFVNGVRARTQDAIEAASEPTEVNAALIDAKVAAAAFMASLNGE